MSDTQEAVWRTENPLTFYSKVKALEIVLYVPPGVFTDSLTPGTWKAIADNHHAWSIEVCDERGTLLEDIPEGCWWIRPPVIGGLRFQDFKGPDGVSLKPVNIADAKRLELPLTDIRRFMEDAEKARPRYSTVVYLVDPDGRGRFYTEETRHEWVEAWEAYYNAVDSWGEYDERGRS